jgi:hypothetical protein
LAEYSVVPIIEFTQWMYSEGVILYHATQDEITRETARLHGSMSVSSSYLLGAKFLSLMKLLPAILKIFAPNVAPQVQIIITSVFNNFLVEALHKHIEFYAIQADVTNDYHKFCLEKPNATSQEKHDYVVKRFTDYKISSPELSREIDDHILLMSEHREYKETQQEQVLEQLAEVKMRELVDEEGISVSELQALTLSITSSATESSTATAMLSLTRATLDSPPLQPNAVRSLSRRMSAEFAMLPSTLVPRGDSTVDALVPQPREMTVEEKETVEQSGFDFARLSR